MRFDVIRSGQTVRDNGCETIVTAAGNETHTPKESSHKLTCTLLKLIGSDIKKRKEKQQPKKKSERESERGKKEREENRK